MYKEDKDKEGKKFIDEIKKGIRSGKDFDPGINRTFKDTPDEELNKAIGAPKGTIIKPVKMPEIKVNEDEMMDFGGGMKIRRGDLKPVPMPTLKKKGGKIDLNDCKVNTSKKNSSSPKW